MATAETGNGAYLSADGDQARTETSREHRYIVEIFDGADDALAALDVIDCDLCTTGFQTLGWLTILYEELAHARRVMPRLVVVSDGESNDVVLALPLVVAKEKLLRVASFADCGVSDCAAPILGPALNEGNHDIAAVWRTARAAMRDVDLIRLQSMPAEIGGRRNPLIDLSACAPARARHHSLVIEDGYEAYLQNLGKKYRKDLERCLRLWESEGNPRLFCATSDDEIAHVFATLEEQQAVWHAAHGTEDIFADPAARAFYERLVFDGADAGLTQLFALEANGRIVAILLGLTHEGTFTVLRVSTGGEQWSHLSPGRLVILETVKHLAASGVRRFELGVNANSLKHGFGTQEAPLYDLVVAQDLSALPKILAHELAAHLRGASRLKSALKRAIPRLRG